MVMAMVVPFVRMTVARRLGVRVHVRRSFYEDAPRDAP